MSNLYVYLICSRNKDNKTVPNFKGRTKTFLEYKENEDKAIEAFKEFAAKGVPGEQTRLYRSVNSRDENKVREDLIVRLLRDKPSVTSLKRTLASVAQQPRNRAESKWLFDFDVNDKKLADDFVTDILFYSNLEESDIEQRKTPHGYAIVVTHGFDIRDLMEKWKDCDITLHKDGLLFLEYYSHMIAKE